MDSRIHRYSTVLAAAALAAAVAAATALATPRPQRFVLFGNTIHGVDQPMHVRATGPISGKGTWTDDDNPDGRTGTLTFRLPKGSVVATNRETGFAARPNPRACVAHVVERGTFRIVRGTGAYSHVHGAGAYIRRSKIVGARDVHGRCLGKRSRPAAIYNIVTMTGAASL